METNARKNRLFLGVSLALFLISSLAWAAADTTNAKKKKKPATPAAAQADGSAEPDKILYDRAMADYKKGHYTEARLSFQTLINTYPDSEYLAKAKLGLADSYFKEGGTSNLTQAVSEYKDFGTFFPFLDEAAYAQMQVGMCHYKMMEKSDRHRPCAISRRRISGHALEISAEQIRDGSGAAFARGPGNSRGR